MLMAQKEVKTDFILTVMISWSLSFEYISESHLNLKMEL